MHNHLRAAAFVRLRSPQRHWR